MTDLPELVSVDVDALLREELRARALAVLGQPTMRPAPRSMRAWLLAPYAAVVVSTVVWLWRTLPALVS
jgi:hypothetical protein